MKLKWRKKMKTYQYPFLLFSLGIPNFLLTFANSYLLSSSYFTKKHQSPFWFLSTPKKRQISHQYNLLLLSIGGSGSEFFSGDGCYSTVSGFNQQNKYVSFNFLLIEWVFDCLLFNRLLIEIG